MDFFQQYQQALQQNQQAEALQYLQKHLSIHRQHDAGFYLLGNLLRSLARAPEALRAYHEACRLNPNVRDYHLNLGVTYQGLQQPEKALQAYQQAYQVAPCPEIRGNIAQALLLAGRYETGWPEYEWRMKAPSHRPIFEWYPPERHWQGQPFPGETLVVYHEQGLGDDLQFCRYLPYVKALGGKVIFSTKKSLIPIMASVYGVDQVVEHSPETFATLPFRWAVPLLSLPTLFQTTLHSVPNEVPYLSVPLAYQTKWQTLLSPYLQRERKKIAFVWAGNPENLQGALRSCPLSFWADLFTLPNIQWFSVQKGDTAADELKKALPLQANLLDLTHHIQDFGDTSALLKQMDLLISIDTSVPHLAGALGKPVWLLLPFANEWRWLLRRSDSPWYPSFRLFRQPAPYQWKPVLTKVRQELSALGR